MAARAPALTLALALTVSLALAPAACHSASTAPSGTSAPDAAAAPTVALDGVSDVTLRAWEDTRAGLPPLRIARRDSIERFTALVVGDQRAWRWADGPVPGVPLPAEYARGGSVVARVAMVETAHGEGGFFLAWRDGRLAVRTAAAAELEAFLASFGVSVRLAGD
jgi:hypothetical protein